MIHIQGKHSEKPPSFLTVKIAPIEAIPEESYIRDYGVDTLAPGASSDHHYHDCDEWWIIIDGIARVTNSGKDIQVAPGDMVYTPVGETHKIEAITMVTLAWFEGPLRGKKRKEHLHHDPEERKKWEP